MISRVSFEGTTFREPPFRFEAGTPNIAGVVGLAAALDYVEGIGLERIAEHEHTLLGDATERLRQIEGVRIVGTAEGKTAVLSFVLDGVHAHDVGTVLDTHGVAVRAGHHCAQPVMDRFGVPATARASFGLYNTVAECERLAAGVERTREIFV